MNPQEFVKAIDDWSAAGGAFPDREADGHALATADEARAICRALSSPHLYTVDSISTPALHHLAAYFQSVQAEAAANVLQAEGLPLLRQILRDALAQPPAANPDDWAVRQRTQAHVFVVKVLAIYRQRGDGSLLVRTMRDPRMAEAYLWSVIFNIVAERHPEAVEICDALRQPLPDGHAGVAYLDFCNALALQRRISHHPFDTEAGIARLAGYLADARPEHYSYAVSATASIPFLGPGARDTLMHHADRHPDPLVRLEAAWALAKTGSEFGRQRLAQQCLNPRFATRAIRYLEELGLGAHIPSKAHDPDFMAMAEMCNWLMHPMEFGRAPDEISQCDTRVLNWPPSGDRRQLWLFRYRYAPKEPGAEAQEGIGLVGSVTFALFGEATADLAPEDIYGLHCCWELQTSEDPRAPEERTAATGRRMLAEANPGFTAT